MTTDYGSNPNLDHWVQENPIKQERVREDGQLAFNAGSTLVASATQRESEPRIISTDERGGLSERDRLAVPLTETGEVQEWPSYFDDDKEGRLFSKLSNMSYWRNSGPEGCMSATAVRKLIGEVERRARSAAVDVDQLNEDGDDKEKRRARQRYEAWDGIYEAVMDPNRHDTRSIRELIGHD